MNDVDVKVHQFCYRFAKRSSGVFQKYLIYLWKLFLYLVVTANDIDMNAR